MEDMPNQEHHPKMLAAPPLEWVGPTMRSAESARKIMEWLVGHSGMMEVFYSGLAPIRGTWLP